MICTLLLCLLANQRPLFPSDAPYKDRAGFYRAIDKVTEGMPVSRIKKLLGTPDDVKRGRAELGGLNADEVWCYGTNRHLGFPTLGQVCILKGKVFWATNGSQYEPFAPLLQEEQLRSILRRVFRSHDDTLTYDPLWMVQTANALIDLGKPKAVFALQELERIGGLSINLDGTALLLRLVFDVPKPPGYPPDRSNMMLKELLPQFKRNPRFPMIVLEDIPFHLSLGSFVGTGRFGFDLDFYRKYPIRTTRLSPPDDPFKTYLRLLASAEWPFPARTKLEGRFAVRYEEDEGEALEQVLQLVRDVYQPVDFRSTHGIDGLDFERYYKGFKPLGARWDDSLQRYVRSDGARVAAKRQPPGRYWFPPVHNNMKVEAFLSRNGDSDYVNGGYSADDLSGGPFEPEVLRIVDAATGKLNYWIGIGSRGNRDDSMGHDAKGEAKYLAGKSYKRQKSSHSMTVGLTIPLGKAVRVELVTRGRRLVGPVLKP